MDSTDEQIFEAKIDGISKGLRMGMAQIYAQLLSFDNENIENNKPSFAAEFLKQQADELAQDFEEFMEEQMNALEEFSQYRGMIDKLYEVTDKYGYQED